VETIQICPPRVREAIIGARAALERADSRAPADLTLATEAAEIMGGLTENAELAHALLARPVLARAALTPEQTADIVGQGATEIASSLLRLGTLGLPRDWSPAQGLSARQAETLRKMLLAVVSDPRLVLARLTEELVALRHARELPAAERERRALEARAIYAPLANRLGVWQLKWELEDLAFRYLEPEEYRRVAAALNERRADRERYIEELCAELRAGLAGAGIVAEVYGRPKHIYSIYRKMQRKQLAFEQLFDVRAVRVVLGTIPECYAALGVVHGQWPYIPGEFDDYIATPKGNGYRSIHTAVIGPQGRSVEVQIRTSEMHEHAELGVAAHWTYKEGGLASAQYQRKIEWVRRLLEPQEGLEAAGASADGDLLEGMRTELFSDRVYTLTPKGEVIDLPRGATPLDFAYSVHTSLGHRCRGAKVNGRIVPLTHTLANGEIVEIITGKHEAPSRDWLAPEHGYLISPRNRGKVRAWFRRQDVGDNRVAGRSIAERELGRIGARPEQLGALTAELKARDTDHLYQLLGEGEITVTQLVRAATRLLEPARPLLRPARVVSARRRGSPVEIEGVGDLPVTLARCCAPLRPQPITGYVTLGRGVTVHRSDCASLQRMSALKPDRVLKVEWSSGESGALTVGLAVSAYDRRGLLRDLTDVLTVERLSIDAVTSRTDHEAGIAYFDISVAVDDLEQLARVLRRLAGVPNVIEARRRR
jgi:GTP pyrophosphokinase